MSRGLSSRSAKKRVVTLCEVLAASDPRVMDREIQNAAIDLHDIEVACEKGRTAISRLRRHNPEDKRQTRDMLIDVDIGVFDELASHITSLRRFLKKIGIRDSGMSDKTAKSK